MQRRVLASSPDGRAPTLVPLQPAPRAGDSTDARLRQLGSSASSKAQGVLTDAEFETQKRKLLSA